jgi:hypothetical protein
MLVGHGVAPSVGLEIAERIHQTYRFLAEADPFYRKNDTLLLAILFHTWWKLALYESSTSGSVYSGKGDM